MMGYLYPFPPDIPRTQDFGNPQRNAIMNNGLPHNGDDYGTPIGTPVHAAGDGVIDYAGEFDDTYADNYAWNTNMGGLMVWLNCGDNEPSFEYGHLSEVFVTPGQRVKRGDVIALTGVSGGATGPHCHVGCLPPNYVLQPPLYGRVNPRTYMTDYYQEETEMPERVLIDAQQAEDIAQRAAALIIEKLTATPLINAQQADDIAQAAARYTKTH